MKIIVIISLVFFSFSVTSMEQPKQRKRRSELENLTEQETIIGKFLCEYEGCNYVGTYKTVQSHERSEHGIYKTKKTKVEPEDLTDKINELKKQDEANYDLVTQDTKQAVREAIADAKSPSVEKEPTMQPQTPEKKLEYIPDQPHQFRPFNHHALTSEDSRLMTLAPFVMMQTVYERNHEKKQARLQKLEQEKKDYNIPSSWKCQMCGKSFEKKNTYWVHLMMMHNCQFPTIENDKAHKERIQRLIHAPSDEIVTID